MLGIAVLLLGHLVVEKQQYGKPLLEQILIIKKIPNMILLIQRQLHLINYLDVILNQKNGKNGVLSVIMKNQNKC